MKMLTEIDYLSCILIDWKAAKVYQSEMDTTYKQETGVEEMRWVEVNGWRLQRNSANRAIWSDDHSGDGNAVSLRKLSSSSSSSSDSTPSESAAFINPTHWPIQGHNTFRKDHLAQMLLYAANSKKLDPSFLWKQIVEFSISSNHTISSQPQVKRSHQCKRCSQECPENHGCSL